MIRRFRLWRVRRRINHSLTAAGWPLGLEIFISGPVAITEVRYAGGIRALEAIEDATESEFPRVARYRVLP